MLQLLWDEFYMKNHQIDKYEKTVKVAKLIFISNPVMTFLKSSDKNQLERQKM